MTAATLRARGHMLDQLVALGYGYTHDEVLEYLMLRGLDDLIRAGVLTISTAGASALAPQPRATAAAFPERHSPFAVETPEPGAAAAAGDDVLPARLTDPAPVAPPAANGHAAAPGTSVLKLKPRVLRERLGAEGIAKLKAEYMRSDDVGEVARQYLVTKSWLYNFANSRGWQRRAKRVPPPKGTIVPARKPADMPPQQVDEITRLWKRGEAIRDIANEVNLPPAKVLAAVAQLGLTNDPERQRNFRGAR